MGLIINMAVLKYCSAKSKESFWFFPHFPSLFILRIHSCWPQLCGTLGVKLPFSRFTKKGLKLNGSSRLKQKKPRPWTAHSVCMETHRKRKPAPVWSKFLKKRKYCYSANKQIWKEKMLDNWLLQNSLQSSWHTSFNEYYNSSQQHQHYKCK